MAAQDDQWVKKTTLPSGVFSRFHGIDALLILPEQLEDPALRFTHYSVLGESAHTLRVSPRRDTQSDQS